MTPQEFMDALAPAARQSMAATGIPASFTLAEAALESGWGVSQLALQARNLFGVKADASWRGATLSLPTREHLHGAWVFVPALWRKYPDWQGCFTDHAAFLTDNPRYHAAFALPQLGPDDSQPWGEAFAEAVAAAGYATDPDYAAKLIAVMREHDLAQYDAG